MRKGWKTPPLPLGRRNGTRRTLSLPYRYRQYHLHILGQFGLGKSKFMEHLIRHDIESGQGLCLLDPHGSLYSSIVEWCAYKRYLERRKIHLIDLSAEGWCFGFNPLNFSGYSPDQVSAAVATMVKACTQVWGGEDMTATPRLARILPTVLFALGEKGLTLAEVPTLLQQGALLSTLARKLSNRSIRDELAYLDALPVSDFIQQTESTRNRLTAFLQTPMVRAMVGQTENIIDFRKAMDEGAVVLVNLNLPNHEASRLLGSLLLSEIYSRARLREPDVSRPFYLYIDECYEFLNSDIERIITGMRKFGLWLTLAHQNLGQLKDKAGDAVFSAVMQIPNRIAFGGLPPDETEYLAKTMFLGEFDFEKPKESMLRPVVTDYIVTKLKSQAESVSVGESFTSGQSSSRSSSRSAGLGTGFSTTIGPNGEVIGIASSESSFDSSGSGETEGTSYAETDSMTRTTSYGSQEALRPVLTMMPTVLFSPEEQLLRYTALLQGQPSRHAVAKLFDYPPVEILTPFVDSPTITERYVGGASEKAIAKTPFSLRRAEAEERIRARRARLDEDLNRSVPEDPDDFLE